MFHIFLLIIDKQIFVTNAVADKNEILLLKQFRISYSIKSRILKFNKTYEVLKGFESTFS